MPSIINRKQTGRLISLHAELKYLKARFNSHLFELKGLKYDSEAEVNPLQFFELAKTHPTLKITYDPYLENPLSAAKFHLTQSIQHDTQKSKSASECLNALEALGWVVREGNLSKLTEAGNKIADLSYSDSRFFKFARESVLGYGVFIGFLFKCMKKMNQDSIVIRDDIIIGYPNNHESITQNSVVIPLSTGSQSDTVIRTRSALFAWAITTGFSLPKDYKQPDDLKSWHTETLDEIAKKIWTWYKFKMFIPSDLFNGTFEIKRPLSYKQMTKSTKALRERGQSSIRLATMKAEEKIKNRRFAIVYALANASEKGKLLNYDDLLDALLRYPNLFIVDESGFKNIMNLEKDIAITAGIPFEDNNNQLKPLTLVKTSVLALDAPKELINVLDQILTEI